MLVAQISKSTARSKWHRHVPLEASPKSEDSSKRQGHALVE